ncbi:MAG TPA: 2-ketoarginine methyltransferase [Kofleriaceae bacterium]|jgi:2-ketoarginine methyltransferase|nr:2-ketoarginine methyltransferase [Kofleriaceae bacterium]
MNSPNTFEHRLVEALQPVRMFATAAALTHLFDSGLYDELAQPQDVARLVANGRDAIRVITLLRFLVNEGYLREDGERFGLTDKGRSLAEFRGWYTMLVGGYGTTFLQLGDALRAGSAPVTRDAQKVGIGSCAISHYDAIPLTRRLMARTSAPCRRLLDLGCGNALYLVEFCRECPEIVAAWGVEPDERGHAAAVEHVRASGLAHRIELRCAGALEFLDSAFDGTPDLTVLGFVLHEILGQSGEDAVVAFLHRLITRFPDLHIIVIEVDDQLTNPHVMAEGLGLAYYNAYYLLHPFTRQRLASPAFWEDVFARAGLDIVARDTTAPEVDSTGLEIGYLLRRHQPSTGRF